MSLLFWKRPPKIPKQEGHLKVIKLSDEEKNVSNKFHSIPDDLSFECVICNKALPPCGLQDFLDYLTYISHDAENLQFYLWMVDYFQRFRHSPKAERAISPRWTGHAPPIREQEGHRMIAIRDADLASEDISDCSTWGGDYNESEFTDEFTQTLGDIKFSLTPARPFQRQQPDPRYDALQWFPAESQPFRREISRITTHYLLPGAPRQLNLSHNDRATVLRALEYTTHPSALRPIKKMLDSTLRYQSHPNFIRWSLRNINQPYRNAVRCLAVATILLGILIAILLVLSHASRYARIFVALLWWFGIMCLFSTSRSFCVIMHRFSTRQHRPWETVKLQQHNPFHDDEAYLKGDDAIVAPAGIYTRDGIHANNTVNIKGASYESTRSRYPMKMEVFGPANNFSGESWVHVYDDKPWWRKVFEGRERVQTTGGIRAVQAKMELWAVLWALIITVPLTVAVVAVPVVGVI